MRVMSGVGVRGGQQRLIPKPGHPYWHFILTHSAVTMEPGSMIFAPSTPISTAFLQKDSTDLIETSSFFSLENNSLLFFSYMEPPGQARGPQKPCPPTPLGAEALRRASAKASVGHPPVSEIRRSMIH